MTKDTAIEKGIIDTAKNIDLYRSIFLRKQSQFHKKLINYPDKRIT